MTGPIPDPSVCPTVTVEQAGEWLGLGRSSAYVAAGKGEIPVLRFGRSLRVPVARLRILLGIDAEPEAEGPTAAVVPMRVAGR